MMNHDGSQQFTFGYGLASTPQIQLQQQQQIQLQQHHFQQQQQQILQHQGNPATIPAQNVFQLQVGGNPTAALLQQNDTVAPIAQHGLISQPLIHASISVSLDNSKPLQGLNNSMEATMVYPQQQSNGLKIITNSGNFVQQPEIHFQSLENLGKSGGVFDGMAGTAQNTINTTFGKQTFSGWVRGDVGNQQYSVGQNTLPSFGHLWSQFQQHKTQVNIVQQQPQPQQQTLQSQSQFHSPHTQLGQQPSQQFTVSGMHGVNNIQMIKVQPNALQDQTVLQPSATHLIQSCTTPVQQNALLTSQHTATSSPLPQQTAFNQIQTCLTSPMPKGATTLISSVGPSKHITETEAVGIVSATSGTLTLNDSTAVPAKKLSKSVQRKLKSSQIAVSSPVVLGISASKETAAKFESIRSRSNANSPLSSPVNTVRVKPSSGKAFSESGPPKVTVTLDSLANDLSQFPDQTDSSFQVIKVAEKVAKLSPKTHSMKTEKSQSGLWKQVHSGSNEKKKMLMSNHLTSSTGSSLDRPSSEDSNFSSPPYSFTPPGSIDSVFSPPPMKDVPLAALSNPLTSDMLLPSSLKCVNTIASSPESITASTASFDEVISNNKPNCLNNNKSQLSNGILPSLQTSMFTNSLMSASCCSIAITTTSVTSSSPRSKGDIAVAASVHSYSPLTSPGFPATSKTHWIADSQNVMGDSQRLVKVPYSWQRKLEDGAVFYISPSGAVLTSLDEIRDYLLSHDTCKCGLECPFHLEDAFVFDPAVSNMPWSDLGTGDNLMGNLCNHRREILAMAAFHQTQTRARQVLKDEDNAKGRKREGKKSLSSGDDFVISPLKKLRTSITNAVNKHAMLRNSSPASCSSIPSPVSELENLWQKDDNVFYPISAPLSSHSSLVSSTGNKIDDTLDSLDTYPPISSGFQRCLKEEKPLKFPSENLVYSNHHPSQRLGIKGNNSHRNQNTFPNSPPFSHTTGSLMPQSSQPQNQKTGSSFPNINSNNTLVEDHSPDLSHNGKEKPSCQKKLGMSQGVSIPSNPQTTYPVPLGMLNKPINSKAKKQQKNYGDKVSRNLSKSVVSESGNKNSLPPPPTTSVSFLENPTVFVAQHTAMINSSMSSYNVDCTSPSPLTDRCDSAVIVGSNGSKKTFDRSLLLLSEEEDADDNLDTSREDDEEHKGCTDLESNKSFSDTTENNDSAYLSQTGSDQEKSDTVDGLDCLSKSSDIYDFSTSEDQLENLTKVGSFRTSSVDVNSESIAGCKLNDSMDVFENCEKETEEKNDEKEKSITATDVKNSGNKAKLKQSRPGKKKSAPSGLVLNNCLSENVSPSVEKSSMSSKEQDIEHFVSSGSLNGDLSQLLASNNWNIPALQKVLAQHAAGDPEHLRQAIQQMMTEITASNDSTFTTNKYPISVSSSLSGSAQSATSLSRDVKEVKQEDLFKQQSNNISDNKSITTSNANISQNSAGRDESVVQKDTQRSSSQTAVCQSDVNCNVTSYVKTPSVKQESVAAKPSTCKGFAQSKVPNSVGVASTGVSVAKQCSPQTSIILNTVKPQVVSMNSSSVSSVSVNVVTNVSKPPMTQVIANNIGLNQTMLPTRQFLGSSSTAHTRTGQLLNPCPSSQNTQIMNMNTLSIPGLNNPLFISNPIQQASPSSVAAQLSPAVAAGQILAQTQQPQQPMQQMSPSFVPASQIPKPSTASISSLAMSNAASTIPIASNPTVAVSGSIPQGALAGSVITGHHTPAINQNTAVAANASVYSATNQPVFVIPQAKPVTPVVQLVGSSQTITPANGLQGDMSQLLSQASISDQNQQLQNLIAASGFNPLGIQQAWNTVNLNAQHQQQQQQQQQQLQLLQLQQLMLPMIGNQNQTIPNASVCPSQSNSLMNAMVGQQGLQINQVVDVKTIQQNLSPAAAAQSFNNPALSPVAQAAFPNQIQQLASPLTVQVGSAAANQSIPTISSQVNVSKSINIIQQQTAPLDQLKKTPSVPAVPVTTVHIAQPSPANSSNKNVDKEINSLTQPEQPSNSTPTAKPAVVGNNSSTTKPATSGKSSSKSKSKSKKSDSSKAKDPQAAKDEEHIANAVNQILAQAVQQQRELTLAAQNQPPPPPKSRNRKRDSQARARQQAAALQAKEQELGKIASISDDAIFHHPLQPPKALPPPLQLPSSSVSLSFPSSAVNQEPMSTLVNASSNSNFAILSSHSSIRPASSLLVPSQSTMNPAPPPLPCAQPPPSSSLTLSGSSSSSSSSTVTNLSSLPSKITPGIHHSQQVTNVPGISSSTSIHKNTNDPFRLQVDKNSPLISCNNNIDDNNISKNTGHKNIAHSLPIPSDTNNAFRKSPLMNQSASVVKSPSSSGTKKSGISLKEHLSSIVFSKDKESGKRKGSATATIQESNDSKPACATNTTSSFTALPFNINPVAKTVVNGDSSNVVHK